MGALQSFDVAVIGLGAMGSSAAYHLARRGKRVLGIEQFGPAHDQGSSHGQSRIIRQAYFEGEAYVALLLRAYELWDQLQHDTGQHLLTITGGLFLGPPDSQVFSGSRASAVAHGLAHEVLGAAEIHARFPPLRPPQHFAGLYEARAGVLDPEGSVRTALSAADRLGASLKFHETVREITPLGEDAGVRITTPQGAYLAARAVVAAGPWTGHFLPDLQLPLSVKRMVMHWFRPRGHAEDFLPDRFPIHIWQLDDGLMFYGFPAADARAEGVKVALHNRNMLPCTPATIDRSVHEDEVEAMRALMAAYLPDLDGEHADARTCMYTMTPDEAFIIDVHPLWPSIALAAGFSGHGFKFASVVGEVLADLACDGATRHDIRLFALNRFQNRGEHDKPSDVR